MKKYTLLLLALCAMQGHAVGIVNAQQELLDKSAAVEKEKKAFRAAINDLMAAADAEKAAEAAVDVEATALKAAQKAFRAAVDTREAAVKAREAAEVAVDVQATALEAAQKANNERSLTY